jgi:hypothetical protein
MSRQEESESVKHEEIMASTVVIRADEEVSVLTHSHSTQIIEACMLFLVL